MNGSGLMLHGVDWTHKDREPPAPLTHQLQITGEPGGGAGQRLDRYLSVYFSDLSRSRLQALIKAGHIDVNGSPAKAKHTLCPGDAIRVAIPPPKPDRALPEDLPLTILHEDSDILVLEKAAGMVVHPAAGNQTGTLVNALLHHCKDLSGIGGVNRPGIVHRLDKDTSGCMVVAKNDRAHHSLAGQFSERSTSKRYLAVVSGIPARREGTLTTNMARHPVNRLRMAVVDPPRGKLAITDYEVLTERRAAGKQESSSSLLLCTIHTGRTHQIRVHCKHLGHPILGDPIYSRPTSEVPRLMLHAWRLSIDHPSTRERLHFESAIPPDFSFWLPESWPASCS